jgi:hypothetical protein
VSDPLNEAHRQQWWTATWPQIGAAAQEQGAWLLFGDAARFAQWGSLGDTWAARGQQPVALTAARRTGDKVGGRVEWCSGRLVWMGQAERLTGPAMAPFSASCWRRRTARSW